MPGMMDNISTLNSVVRTFLAVVLVGGAGVAGLFAWRTYNDGDRAVEKYREAQTQLADATKKLSAAEAELTTSRVKLKEQDEEITKLNHDIELKDAEIERQATAMRLLKRDQRVAVISVIDQQEIDGELFTTLRFVEVNDQNQPIDEPRTLSVKGDKVYIDTWRVTFDDKYIESADLIRGTALLLLKGIHGEFAPENEYHVLDQPGGTPNAFRGTGKPISAFEREIWGDFWEIANNPERAAKLGITANHGVETYRKVLPGQKYKLMLRATGEQKFIPLGDDEPDPTAKPAA